MIASSIVSRGLDIEDLALVINYSIPNSYEDYIHRIGRTGRAYKKGTAITFIDPNTEYQYHAATLIKGLQKAKQTIPARITAVAIKHKHHKSGFKILIWR